MSENGSGDGTFLEPPESRPTSDPQSPPPPPPPPPAAAPPFPPAPRPVPRSNSKATWSLILGIVSMLCCGLLAGIPAIALGFAGKREISLSGGAEGGRGVAIAGIVTGILGTILSTLAMVLIAIGIWAGNSSTDSPPWTPPSQSAADGPTDLKSFYDQHLQWHACGHGRCSRATVPVDYDNPSGQTMSLAVKVIPSTGAGGHSLFVNPGGPGGSGMDFADYMASTFGDRVRDHYDLVGVDPRGVGMSTPIDCLSDRQFDAFAAGDPDPDSPSEVTEYRNTIHDFGVGCEKRSGAVAAHISTEEAARDFDIVRALLGRDTFDWFGASYGTQLGATYATLFPNRVGRMVMDGAVDPSLGVIESSRGQAIGFERALKAYVQNCVQKKSCPLGRRSAPAIDQLTDFLKSTDKHPLKTGEKRKLTEGLAFYGIAVTLYDKGTWAVLSQALDAAFDGDGSVLLRLSDYYFDRKSNGTYSGNTGEAFPAIGCLDTRDRPTLDQVEAIRPEFDKESPVFGPAMAWGALSCTDWPIPATHPQVRINAAKSAPIVVVGTTRDPATPYEWAKALTKQLGSAVLLTRVGDGHTAYTSGSTCITDAVDDYLVDGTVPKPGKTCK